MTDPLARLEASGALPAFEGGTVWLVGAGPGDPGLLTLHALARAAQADAIVYDALVERRHPRFRAPGRGARVRRQARRRAVARPGRHHRAPDRAWRVTGRRVLRLKGGDPFVFGRGGEEAVALARAGVRFRVVPGITAGLGGLAYAGIPATTRDTNHAVILATGHTAPGDATCDWAALAAHRAADHRLHGDDQFADDRRRIDRGRARARHACGGRRRRDDAAAACAVTTLGRAKADVAAQGFKAPAVIAIGSIAALRHVLAPGMVAPDAAS